MKGWKVEVNTNLQIGVANGVKGTDFLGAGVFFVVYYHLKIFQRVGFVYFFNRNLTKRWEIFTFFQ